MSQPWNPLPNPAGQQRRFVRWVIQQWLSAAQIRGLDRVHRSMPVPDIDFGAHEAGGPDTSCHVAIQVPRVVEERTAQVGPINAGGRILHCDVVLRFFHVTWDASRSELGEDDYDRIVDAVKDQLRGRGRDLGRPDVVLSAGEWPRESAFEEDHDEPVFDGTIQRRGELRLNVDIALSQESAP